MPSRRGGSAPTLEAGKPKGVVRHGTATAWGTGAAIARSWRDAFEEHSAHVTCDVIVPTLRDAEVKRWRDLGWTKEAAQLAELAPGAGVIYQHRSFLQGAWHAAGKTSAGEITSATIEGMGFNASCIGVEMTCVGQVARKLDDQWRGWRANDGDNVADEGVGYGPAVPADQVEVIGRKAWHRYHPAALEIERMMDAALIERFPSLAGAALIKPSTYTAKKLGHVSVTPILRMAIGHVDVDPTRKEDPYPTGAGRGSFTSRG
jgi:hypothetical protein